jgi:hypothetical protein
MVLLQYLVLPTHVPYGEADIFVLHRFNIEPDRRDSGDNLPQLQLIQDCRLPIQTREKKSHTIHILVSGMARR